MASLADTTAARYQALLEVSESIAAHQQIKTLIADLSGCLQRLVRFDGITVTLYNAQQRTIRLFLVETTSDLTPPIHVGHTFPVEATPAMAVLESGKPHYVPDLEADNRFPVVHELMRSIGVKSYAIAPMSTARNPFLGGLNFGCRHKNAYTPEDLEFMTQVARQVAVAVENALAHEELTRQRDHLRLLLEVNNAIVTHLDTPSLLHTITTCLRSAMGIDFVGLGLYDEATNQVRRYLADGPEGQFWDQTLLPPAAPSLEAIRTRRPVVFYADQFDKVPADLREYLSMQRVQGVCSVPLLSRGRVLGIMSVGSTQDQPFPEDDVQLLVEVAGQVAIAIDNALTYRHVEELNAKLAREKLYLEDEIRNEFRFEEIIGKSPALLSVLREVETVAPSDSAVVIYGETGTGKELVARAIHDLSARRSNTFVKLNCAAIPTGLLESELFGHEKGAFTGAVARRVGRFELADGGTLFLDEVGEIPLELQPKLLRVLQEQEFERLGSSRTMRVNVRVVAATNRDLVAMVRERKFRDDLYYRLNVFPIHIPALRERRLDIPLLVRHFAQQFARRMGKHVESIPSEVMDALTLYDWPGNVRELQNLIERAVIISPGAVLKVPVEELRSAGVAAGTAQTLEESDRAHILEILRATNWVLSGPGGAAARLGLKRSTLQFRMKKLGITRPE